MEQISPYLRKNVNGVKINSRKNVTVRSFIKMLSRSAAFLTYYFMSFFMFDIVLTIRVCSTFEAYYNPLSSKCFDNPDGEQNITEIIQRWGFTTEEHYLTTKDGYQVHIERTYDSISKKNPIVMVHGLLMGGLGFCVLGEKSLPYILGKAGYDVWILSLRGTLYSRRHVNLTTNDKAYWNFSYHEMAINEVRDTIDMVYELTNEKILYVGYSMGTTTSYIYSSLFPEDAAKKLQAIVSLAPVAYSGNTRTVFRYQDLFLPVLKPLFNVLWHGEIFPLKLKISEMCTGFPHRMKLCETLLTPIVGGNLDQIDPLTYPVYVTRALDSTGIGIAEHWTQNVHSNGFQWFDHGPEKNMELYGQAKPRHYELLKVPVPVTLFVGANDYVADQKDARRTFEGLSLNSQCEYHIVKDEHFNHLNFLGAKNVVPLVYAPVLEVLERMERGECKKSNHD